jgi:hypothetical protein
MEFIKSYGRELRRGHGGTRWKLEEERESLLQVLSKLTLTSGKGRTW